MFPLPPPLRVTLPEPRTMITPFQLKFPLRVRLPVTIKVPCPVGLPGPSVKSPSTNVSTPSVLLAPRPAALLVAAAAVVKYRPWLIAEFIIPSLPYKNSLAVDTDCKKLGLLSEVRTIGSLGVTFGPLPPQLVPSA